MGNLVSSLLGPPTTKYYQNYETNEPYSEPVNHQPKIDDKTLQFINSFKVFRERYSNIFQGNNSKKTIACNSFVVDVMNNSTLVALYYKDDTKILYEILEEFNNEDKEKIHAPVLKKYMDTLEIALVVFENK